MTWSVIASFYAKDVRTLDCVKSFEVYPDRHEIRQHAPAIKEAPPTFQGRVTDASGDRATRVYCLRAVASATLGDCHFGEPRTCIQAETNTILSCLL